MRIGLYLLEDHYMPYPSEDFYMMKESGFESIALDLMHFYPPKKQRKQTDWANGMRLPSSVQERVACSFTEGRAAFINHFSSYKKASEENGLFFTQLEAPSRIQISQSGEPEADLRLVMLNCIELCGFLKSPFLIIPPFSDAPMNSEQEWEENKDFYLSLIPAARENNIILCLTNRCIYDKSRGRFFRGPCCDLDLASVWVNRLNEIAQEDRFAFCLNTGTCNLLGQNLYAAVTKLENRLQALRIRDNDGTRDLSCMPYGCTLDGGPSTDWCSLVKGLREIGYKGALSFDQSNSVNSFPSSMRFTVLRLVNEMGRLWKEQIELEKLLASYEQIVLFGAGNMFDNYMDVYGEKYQPVFALDNNNKLWGTKRRGILIKAPEAIWELEGMYGVFVCNQFYYEIQKQLEALGTQNIHIFNDEYMPFKQKGVEL